MTADHSGERTPLVDLQCEAHTYPDGTVGMHEIDFSVYPNEVVALVGGNGAGKSTLLEHLNATLVPDEGELIVDGTAITEDNKAHARKAVGFVFQDADTQLVAPTVLDDVLFGLQNYGITGEEAERRAREALATVDASHLEDRIPHYLSGGEKRLIGLAGVLVLNPSVVVLDEPLAGLDPERSRLVAKRIRQIHQEGISVVLSTHDLEFAAEIADRVCVMADGNIIESDTPQAVFYDDELLNKANLRPPTAVRIAHDIGVDSTAHPVTEADLVSIFSKT
ncbi:energy-coupling factor ABC transporter ATP-binding protein [Haloquadratum walsbyi]|uniref:ABC-type transport system ATP-binding protein (Probable substrate cobalt/nickel/biotin) n=1 Tax=Haloquadratum walsbyi (strain DSM 16854 / JCM 12705 / C23) TaxID=768065 RepID=G0LKU9_HALWC|nr:ABC transporter ATP-binding protein [Haloquadratum walsbyi]CCC40389.1 ABC-type transport system ATP-binding protein (probable substrate cobalt/nickel/biotin) [Haloquadratum walsbyi C23]